MKLLIFLTFAIIFVQKIKCLNSDTVDVFEFGHNEGIVAFTKSNKIGLLEKNVDVPIVLPYCMDLSYIRVVVDNTVGPPKVDFDEDVNTVRIKYRPLQHSLSSYTVTAKAKRSSSCHDRDYMN